MQAIVYNDSSSSLGVRAITAFIAFTQDALTRRSSEPSMAVKTIGTGNRVDEHELGRHVFVIVELPPSVSPVK